ncbi:MAG: hypothetical protein OXJ64_14085 [Boseongicola sp.]|nr:hypothetical protein [Boseongicola sp.]
MSTKNRDVVDVMIDLYETHTWTRIALNRCTDNRTEETRRNAIYWLAKAEFHNIELRTYIDAENEPTFNFGILALKKDCHTVLMDIHQEGRLTLGAFGDNPTWETRQAALDALAKISAVHHTTRAQIEKERSQT